MDFYDSSWILCTRTAKEDYFWLYNDGQGKQYDTPKIYSLVGDETSERTGFYWRRNGRISVCISDLDAERNDIFGRKIRHVLILSANESERDKVEFINWAFSEAIKAKAGEDTAAAKLSRKLYEAWDQIQGQENQNCPIDWFELKRKNSIFSLPYASPACAIPFEFGRQYIRDQESTFNIILGCSLGKLFQGDGIFLYAYANSVSSIEERLQGIHELQHTKISVCTARANNESPFPEPVKKNKKVLVILGLMALMAVVLWIISQISFGPHQRPSQKASEAASHSENTSGKSTNSSRIIPNSVVTEQLDKGNDSSDSVNTQPTPQAVLNQVQPGALPELDTPLESGQNALKNLPQIPGAGVQASPKEATPPGSGGKEASNPVQAQSKQ